MKIFRFILIALVCFRLCGCATRSAIEAARGWPDKDKDGKSVPSETPKPGYYALLPLAVPFDVAASPFYLLFYLWTKAIDLKS